MRILVVDDEIVSRKKLQGMLQTLGQVVAVENGEEALSVANSPNPPDLILLDIMMPGMDGYEVCKRLKADTRTSHIPVIFASVRSEEEHETKGLGLGAVDYITKPYSPPIVKARVRAHLELKKHRDHLEELVTEATAELKKRNKEMQVEIAERKRAEEALRKSEERYRDLFDSISDFIFSHDLNGRFMTVNRAAANGLGYSPEELMGRVISDFMLPQYRDAFENEYLPEIKKEGSLNGITVYLSKDGTKRYIEYRNVVVQQDPESTFISGSGRDITERFLAQKDLRKLEDRLRQAQKMEAIGTLAGGVAHDFNNLLMAIQGNVSLLLVQKDANDPDYTRLRNIEQYIQEAAGLTKQLLSFARAGKCEFRPTAINELMKKSLDIFSRTKKEISIQQKYQKDIRSVEIDQGQIEQALTNLYVNAWQAMPGGGRLLLETENVALEGQFVKPYGVRPGKYVKISITDTGVGMDKETRERAFDPFFTTKALGRGAGLGLASSYGIIKNHGGIIDVKSKKGEGSTFIIYLPASEKGFGPGDHR